MSADRSTSDDVGASPEKRPEVQTFYYGQRRNAMADIFHDVDPGLVSELCHRCSSRLAAAEKDSDLAHELALQTSCSQPAIALHAQQSSSNTVEGGCACLSARRLLSTTEETTPSETEALTDTTAPAARCCCKHRLPAMKAGGEDVAGSSSLTVLTASSSSSSTTTTSSSRGSDVSGGREGSPPPSTRLHCQNVPSATSATRSSSDSSSGCCNDAFDACVSNTRLTACSPQPLEKKAQLACRERSACSTPAEDLHVKECIKRSLVF